MSSDEVPLGRVDLDLLLHEVLGRVDGLLGEQRRQRVLLDAVVALAADLSLDGVLQGILTAARALVGARYAAIGVLEIGPGRRLRTFVHQGVDVDTAAEIGPLPQGDGILGLITERDAPLRLSDLAAHPASSGFPDRHPPMSTFLGVPVRIRDRTFGNLYLTEKRGGVDFTAEDQEVVLALAAAAGVAIENARLYEDAERRQTWLAASADVTALLTGAVARQDALHEVADRARAAAGSDGAWIALGREPEELVLRVVAGPVAEGTELRSVALDRSLTALAVSSEAPVSSADLTSDPRSAAVLDELGWPSSASALVVPLRAGGQTEGALGLLWWPDHQERFHALAPELPARFAEQVALAMQVSRARDDQQRLAVLEDRDRIGRDLHDVVIQRLFAIGLSVGAATELADAPEVTRRLAQAVSDLDATIADLRRSIFALGVVGQSGDVQSEITQLVDRAAQTLGFRPRLRLAGPLRTTIRDDTVPDLLAVLAEALSNAARHAHARSVEVEISVTTQQLALVVTDDGVGMAADVVESGLRNIRHRAERLGGTSVVEPGGGGGTRLRWSVPLTRPG
jgi:signal transduction histidine kinase